MKHTWADFKHQALRHIFRELWPFHLENVPTLTCMQIDIDEHIQTGALSRANVSI
jgi:hypothetical protein